MSKKLSELVFPNQVLSKGHWKKLQSLEAELEGQRDGEWQEIVLLRNQLQSLEKELEKCRKAIKRFKEADENIDIYSEEGDQKYAEAFHELMNQLKDV
jgi:septal ring factor EnvC (AmiA/AmiB activator)